MPATDFYAAALAAKQQGKRVPLVREGDPQPGYYKIHAKSRGPAKDPEAWVAVKIAWDAADIGDNELLVIYVSGKSIPNRRHENVWPACAAHPITVDEYRFWRKHDRWPSVEDLSPTPAPKPAPIAKKKQATVIPPSAPKDHNRRHFPEEVAEIIEKAENILSGISSIDDETLAQKVASCKNKLTSAFDTLEDLRKAEVGPLNDKVKELNARWKISTSHIEKLKSISTSTLGAYMQREGLPSISPGPGERTVTLAVRHEVELIDVQAAMSWACKEPKVLDAILTAARVLANKGVLTLKGIKTREKFTAV